MAGINSPDQLFLEGKGGKGEGGKGKVGREKGRKGKRGKVGVEEQRGIAI